MDSLLLALLNAWLCTVAPACQAFPEHGPQNLSLIPALCFSVPDLHKLDEIWRSQSGWPSLTHVRYVVLHLLSQILMSASLTLGVRMRSEGNGSRSVCLSVCLSVYDYSRTTGYEAAYERYQQLQCYKVKKITWRFC